MAKKNDAELDNLRLPPNSIEAEQAVIGGLLRDNTSWDRISGSVSAIDFYRWDHRAIFEHIIYLIDQDRSADVITVHELLVQQGKAEGIGGMAYLNSMAQSMPSTANIARYAEIVRNRAVMRKLIEAANDICDEAYKMQGEQVSAVLDFAEQKILAIAEGRTRGAEEAVQLRGLLTTVVERVDELYSRSDDSGITGVPTGFGDLDEMTSGLHAGDLVVIAGRPSMGKTAFAVNIGENITLGTGLPVLIYSMEMGGTQLATRMLGSVGKVNQQRLRSGRLDDSDWPRITDAVIKLSEVPVYIDETPSLTATELRSRARRTARKVGKLGVIIVDYLQLMVGSSKDPRYAENRATEVGEISRSLKALAKELHCPVVALSQLNRSLESRPNKRPIMSDLRESGAIEQDADVIIFLYRDEVYNPDSSEKGVAEAIVAKQRSGPTGTVRLTWTGEYTKFSDYSGSARTREM